MPGYDKVRFVDVGQDDLDEFTCGICMEVFDTPIFSPCCRSTFCTSCITEWLNRDNTCPNDRRVLTVNDMTPPSRALINLLNKLKISCDFKDRGCESVVQLCELRQHCTHCDFNPGKYCPNCGLSMGSDNHNCIENLKIKVDSINDEMTRLANENRELMAENVTLRRNMNSGNRDDKRVRIVSNKMCPRMQAFALRIANEAHDLHRQGPEGTISTHVRNTFEKKYKGLWNCLVSTTMSWGTSLHHYENHYTYFKIGLFHFMIWESSK